MGNCRQLSAARPRARGPQPCRPAANRSKHHGTGRGRCGGSGPGRWWQTTPLTNRPSPDPGRWSGLAGARALGAK
eukprot:8012581-Lingulodinium_polyedra.AAC.1